MLNEFIFQKEYLPHSEFSAEEFFRNAIVRSIFYRRAAGYFSSGVLSLFNEEILNFAKRGGKIQLICSDQLARSDIEQLEKASLSNVYERSIDVQIKELEKYEETKNAISFFGTLISLEILSIKIANYSTGGLFHDKTGCFSDEIGNSVTFRGSSNETFMGWSKSGNFETLETFSSWDINDSERVENHKSYLDKIWNDRLLQLKVTPINEVDKNYLISKSKTDIDDFLPMFEELKGRPSSVFKEREAHTKRSLEPFQSETLLNWKKHDHRGIINHATGSGKTVTAIHAVYEHIQTGWAAIILVPSVLLLKQWHQELLRDIPHATIQLCGAGNTTWKGNKRIINLLQQNKEKQGAIILAVLDTFSSKSFLNKLSNLENILLVADEVHTLGSLNSRPVLGLNFGKRLGLSATPERHRDADGTKLIFDFFERELSPVISIKDAIEKGRLVNYIYEPLPVKLDENEMLEWKKLTKKIITLSVSSEDKLNVKKDNYRELLLIKRSQIIKKASSKIPVAVSHLLNNYCDDHYWLIYCEDSEQLTEMDDALRKRNISSFIYKTDMGPSKEIELTEYIKTGGVMLSIKCLDEGVDIPRISHAMILASSQNPRQFIQRRGRVLRVDGIKEKAHIFDLFTIPNIVERDVPDAFLFGELKRAMEFAEHALNKNVAKSRLRKFLLDLNIDIESLKIEDL